uniref:Uncharacterized protein n=1 Tax=Trichobilharzia regenti TaxID=157069 RepID=A0AA85IVK0_TRIRE|nr:unnamed protein product [Trichobilharzia regenti]
MVYELACLVIIDPDISISISSSSSSSNFQSIVGYFPYFLLCLTVVVWCGAVLCGVVWCGMVYRVPLHLKSADCVYVVCRIVIIIISSSSSILTSSCDYDLSIYLSMYSLNSF